MLILPNTSHKMTKQMMNLRRIRAAVFIGLNFSLRQNQKKLSMKKNEA